MKITVDRLHYLGVLSLLSQASVHVDDDLRDCIAAALQDSPITTGVRQTLNRIDFTTDRGVDSFEHGLDDVKRVADGD